MQAEPNHTLKRTARREDALLAAMQMVLPHLLSAELTYGQHFN